MFRYTTILLIATLLSGLFGFTTLAGTSYLFAQRCFFAFLLLFVISIVLGHWGHAHAA